MSKRHLTLWDMLVWTYARQRAHVLLNHPSQWLRFMVAVTEDQQDDKPRPAVHVDAAVLHAHVLDLGENDACLLVDFARQACQPRPSLTQPMPHPTTALTAPRRTGDERWGWSETSGGGRIEYLIRTAEIAVELEAVVERVRGRKGVRVTGYRTAKVPVEYCPLVWDPDPVWTANVCGIFNDWLEAMRRLHEAVDGLSFREHVVVSLGVDGEPVPVDAPEIHDARALRQVVEAVVDEAVAPAGVLVDDRGERLLYRVGRAKVERR